MAISTVEVFVYDPETFEAVTEPKTFEHTREAEVYAATISGNRRRAVVLDPFNLAPEPEVRST